MAHDQAAAPDSTAVRVALWRALHVLVDPPPHVLEDEVGLELADPDDGWRSRPDMDPDGTRLFRASIVARLAELGFGIPEWLRLVPVDFEAGQPWPERLAAAGFDAAKPAVVSCTGVSMYLTREANVAALRQVASLAAGSTLATTFLLPLELTDPDVRPGLELAVKGARASGTPFISFFTPAEMLALAREAGFREVRHVSAATLAEGYFADRSDGLRPPDNSEELLVATA
jgi:O-methyltransferase involved in polyketide biosynthesis